MFYLGEMKFNKYIILSFVTSSIYARCSLHTHWILHTAHYFTLCSLRHWTVKFALHVTLNTHYTSFYNSHSTLLKIAQSHYALNSAHYTIYATHCTLHTVHCTLYTAWEDRTHKSVKSAGCLVASCTMQNKTKREKRQRILLDGPFVLFRGFFVFRGSAQWS